MKKHQLDFTVKENRRISNTYSLLILSRTDGQQLPESLPGQFVEVLVPDARNTLLRRPISISHVTGTDLCLLIRRAGNATDALCDYEPGKVLNILYPLGNGFSTDGMKGKKTLLVGGGVGIAPMWQLAEELSRKGADINILTGARTKDMLLLCDELAGLGKLHISTDDGSEGEPGVVTANSVWNTQWDMVYVCGPAPMMKAVAKICREKEIPCEVSLENMMACGLGACLCCVEKTVKGNVCVCTEGPVLNINQLLW